MSLNSGSNLRPDNPWREKWVHEDHLINFRLTWLLISQTLLFAGYATLLDVLLDAQKCVVGDNRGAVLGIVKCVMPLIGCAIAILVFIGVVAALIAMCILKCNVKRDPVWTIDRLDVNDVTTVMGWVSGGAFPLVFLFAWLWVMCWARQLS